MKNKITPKAFQILFGCDEDSMAEVIKKVEMIEKERNDIIENRLSDK